MGELEKWIESQSKTGDKDTVRLLIRSKLTELFLRSLAEKKITRADLERTPSCSTSWKETAR